MELEKCESNVVSRLYALRGGLSALSVKYDQTRKIDENFYEELHTVADTAGGARYEAPQGTVEYAEWLAGYGFENELNRRLNSITNNYVEDKREKEYKVYAQNCLKSAIKWLTLIILCSIACFTLPFLLAHMIIDAKEKYQEVYNISFNSYFNSSYLNGFGGFLFFAIAAISLVALICAIIFIIFGIRDIKLYRKSKKISDYTKDLNFLQRLDEYNKTEANKNTAQANIDKLPQVREEAEKVLGKRNAIVNSLVKYCNEYYKALLQEFNPLLDERDWKHLDLVIYELETRRADTVKEALQLVDRELQTERIERTIGEATKAICYTVARGFNELQSTVKICCDRICDKLDDISSQLDNVMALQAIQSIQLAGISGQLADLTDSVNVGNALQAKANETSAQLCSDVHALRYYS